MKVAKNFRFDPDRTAVVIKRNSRKGFGEQWDYFFETRVLHKRTVYGYFNSVYGNRRIWPAFLMAFEFFTVTFLVSALLLSVALKMKPGLSVELRVGMDQVAAGAFVFVGTWLGLFWQEKRHIYSKWEYLAGLYNSILLVPGSHADLYSHRDLSRVALAIDILELEMWAHRSFSPEFKETLTDAIRFKKMSVPNEGEAEIGRLTTYGITKKDALQYLTEFQSEIFAYLKQHSSRGSRQDITVLLDTPKSQLLIAKRRLS